MNAPETQIVSVNSIRLAYWDWPGEKGPIICVPHITGHKGTFAALAQQLSPHYRVIALDLRGRGESDKPEMGYGFSYHARDIVAFAEALKCDSFILAGHSFGATTSVYTASVRPDRVRALVLMDGGADPRVETLRAMYPTVKRLAKVYSTMEEYLASQRSVVYHKPWTRALEEALRQDMEVMDDGSVRSKSSAQAIEHDLDMHFWENVWFHLPQVQCPAIFLRPTEGLMGATGHVYSDADAERLTSLIPNCRKVDVPGGNHYTFVIQDNPPVAAFIRTFLEERVFEAVK
ncbi:MAG TPA: alpha/beta hydrolase [Bacteroidota bacterium]|nr:alpha/beta hydrolase [Bacteroidota bacterium]